MKTSDFLIKKILLLGGGYSQVPAIEKAKERGFHTLLCDYLPESPGHKVADQSFYTSTLRVDEILQLAKSEKVSAVLAYASDPAVYTAALVSENLGFPTNSKDCIFKLTNKGAFRNLLENLDLPVPKRLIFDEAAIQETTALDLVYPLIIKPIDSSGSKGVKKIHDFSEFHQAGIDALKYSNSKQIIVEEYIDNSQADIHGDGFVIDGNLVFCHLGDHIYGSKSNEFNPTGTMWPSIITEESKKIFLRDIQKVLRAAGYNNGPINIEARINSRGEHFLMEIGPRNGGHFVPQAIFFSTGFDMLNALFDLIDGVKIEIHQHEFTPVAYYAVNSAASGQFDSLEIDDSIVGKIVFQNIYKVKGDEIQSFTGSNAAIGVLIFRFSSMEEMHEIMPHIHQYVKVNLF